jgi:hypothetical protein
MEGQGLQYQTIQVQNRVPMRGGPSTRGAAVGAGIKLLQKASKALNGFAVSYRVTREIDKLQPKILNLMSAFEAREEQSVPGLGVLVVVGIQSGDPAKFVADPGKMFLSIHIGGVGTDFRQTVKKYIRRPKIVAGPSRDWVREDHFVWVTRSNM